jgi:glycosyltransferase involved in cell wall biosynthesis
MKIIHIISSLGNGGAEKLVVELSNEMAKGHEIVLVSFRDIEDWMNIPKLISDEVILIQLGKKAGISFKLYIKLILILQKEKPDIVHSHLHSTLKYITPLTYIFIRVKFIHTIHTNLVKSNYIKYSIINRFSIIFKRIHYVCLSPTIRAEYSSSFSNMKFACVSNGIAKMQTTDSYNDVKEDLKKLKNRRDVKIALCVGRIDQGKNYKLLLDAFLRLKELPLIAVVVGDIENGDKNTIQIIEEYKLDNVYFIGPQSNVADFMELSDLFVMTSTYEGMPLTILEALSFGLPIVSTPAGGIVDVVDENINGFLSKDYSVDSFINSLMLYYDMSQKMLDRIKINNMAKYSKKYSIDVCSNEYIELYKVNHL